MREGGVDGTGCSGTSWLGNQHLQWWLETQRAGKVAVEHGQEDTVPCAGDEGRG